MLVTLQGYILREITRTTVLTALGLTAVLSMGGGVLNIVDLGQVTGEQLVRLMGFVVPVAATLSLPVAALFGAAATYGRLSADNEFIACRASGINILRLFLPAGLIAVFCAAVTISGRSCIVANPLDATKNTPPAMHCRYCRRDRVRLRRRAFI